MTIRSVRADRTTVARRAATWIAALLVWSCSGSTATDAVNVGDVVSVEVAPSTSALALGAQLPLSAVARDADGKIVSNASIVWSVKDPGIASVSPIGVVTGVALGSTQVAASANGKSGIAAITVLKTPVASLVVRPTHVDATPGMHAQLTAITYDAANNILSDRAVVWTSSNSGVATVDATGTVTAVAPGSATITGTAEGKSDAATIAVTQATVATVAVAPNPLTVMVGQTSQLTATPHDANGNAITGRPVSWSSSNTAIATVSDSGVVTAVAAGTTTISATVDGKTGSTAVTVTNVPVASVTVQPPSATVAQGSSVQFFATVKDANGTVVTDRAVSWASTNDAVAVVSPGGVVTGKGAGTATISATSEGVSGTATVTVTATVAAVASVTVQPSSDTIGVGKTVTLTATTKDASGNVLTGRTITWTSSNTSVATVSSTGVVTGVNGGTATITASSEGKSGTSAITVTPVPVGSVTVQPSTDTVYLGKTVQLTATVKDTNGTIVTDRPVTWSSSNTSIATVDANGLVTGVSLGTVTITAKSETKSGTSSVSVTPVPVASVTIQPPADTIVQNQTTTFTAITKDADGNVLTGRSVTWSSSNTSVATITSTGTAKGGVPGTASITATSEGKSGTATLLVNPAPVATVTVSPATATIGKGKTVQLTATAKDANGQVLQGRTFTWTSSNDNIATVSSSGLVFGVSGGIVTITATCDLSGGKFGTSIVTVGK